MPHRTDPRPLHCAVLPFADFGHVAPSLGVARALIAARHRVTYVVDERYAGLVEEAGARAVTYTSARGEFYRAADPAPGQLAAEGYALLVDTIRTVFPAALTALAQDPRTPSSTTSRTSPPDGSPPGSSTPCRCRCSPATRRTRPSPCAPRCGTGPTRSWPRALRPHRVHGRTRHRPGRDEPLRHRVGRAQPRLPAAGLPDRGRHLRRPLRVRGPHGHRGPGRPLVAAADGRRTALVSLGTESGDRGDFFRTCAQAFDPASWHVVMTLGHGADRAQLGPLPAHVEVHEWLPHPAVLPHADVLVCHAGMGSLMEALYFATPVVAIPRAHELGLSAQRLEECGVGRTLSRTGLDAEVLARTVNGLLADPGTPAALRRMRAAVRDAGGAARAADTLQGWAAQHRRHRTGS
ncbi:nucleotide disphospho-sugar-binding domain-containing protein [Streptomyces kaempferi]